MALAPRGRQRGLPSDRDLDELAETYLTTQRRVSPETVGNSDDDDALRSAMVQQFKDAFTNADWAANDLDLPTAGLFAACYLRYSDDHSNSRSLSQQLVNCLEKASKEGAFIPWSLVFADAAVTGGDEHRYGYQMFRKVLAENGPVRVLFFDELSRISRNTVETVRVSEIAAGFKIRLLGASDGFDSLQSGAQVQAAISGVMNEMYLKQTSDRVHRGLRDAFEQNKEVRGDLGFGYKKVLELDEHGQPIIDSKQIAATKWIICPDDSKNVQRIFDLFVNQGWSRNRIAKLFNEERVGGKQTWDHSRIKKLLKRELYKGHEIRHREYYSKDPLTKRKARATRPENEWRHRQREDLRIVPDDIFDKAQERLKEFDDAYSSRQKEAKKSRAALKNTLLFRPICRNCGLALIVGCTRTNSSLTCENSKNRKRGCTLGYKSSRILESCLLGWMQESIFDEAFKKRLLDEANEFLVAEASRPPVDTAPLQDELKQTKNQLKRLGDSLVSGDGELETVLGAVKRLEARRDKLTEKLKELEARNLPSPGKLTAAEVDLSINALRELLNGEVSAAATVLQKLTGPILVHSVKEEGKRCATWYVEFTADVIPALAAVASFLSYQQACPITGVLDHLATANWTIQIPVELELDAPRFKALDRQKTRAETTRQNTDRQPESKSRKYSEEVVALRNDGHRWSEIARIISDRHGVSFSKTTALRAFDHADANVASSAVASGHPANRGTRIRLAHEVRTKLISLLHDQTELTNAEIARQAGCSVKTIARARKKFATNKQIEQS